MTLSKAHQLRLCVEVQRIGQILDELEGVVLEVSPQWCLLASVKSFDTDGFWIIRKNTIRKIHYRRFEAFRHRILAANGTIAKLRPPRGLDIKTTSSLMDSLIRLRQYAVIYRETKDEWWSLHSAILGLEEESLLLHGFDGAGCFEPRARQYRVADITCVRIGGRYLREYQSAAPYDYNNQIQNALRPIASLISKSEKAQKKLASGTWQHTMLQENLKALRIAAALMNGKSSRDNSFAKEDLKTALTALASMTRKTRKALTTFLSGTAQHTLSKNRLKALRLAATFIKQELGKKR